uniref:Uncharacterized protein n=1 Tax=Culex tarsalis TaxID=7177 RepID=A0A1Q3EV89_CULTA
MDPDQQPPPAQPESAESAPEQTTDSEQQPPNQETADPKSAPKPKPKPAKRTKHDKKRPPKPVAEPAPVPEPVPEVTFEPEPPKPPAKPSVSLQVQRGISPIPEVPPKDSTLPRQSSVVSEPEMIVCGSNFKPWALITAFSVHWIASFAILIIGLAMTLVPPSAAYSCHVYFVVVYLRMVYWIGTFVQHELIKAPCRRLINQNYNLYRDMICYRKAPLKVVSIWNAVLVATQGYVYKQFHVKDYRANICSAIGPDMTPQLFIVVFCGLETIMLGIFYVPAIKRLLKSLTPQEQEEDARNGTLLNQDEIPINWRLMRQAEQIKILTVANQQLRREALDIGALE